MAKLILKDFTGGISDRLQNVDPTFCDECDNLLITPSQGLAIRDGSIPYDENYPTPTNKVGITRTFNFAGDQYVVSSAGKLYRSDSDTPIQCGDLPDVERWINPNFSGSAGGWTLGGGWSYGSNKVHHTAGNAGQLYQTAGTPVVENEIYILRFSFQGNSDPCVLEIYYNNNIVQPSIRDESGNVYLYGGVGTSATCSLLFYAIDTGDAAIQFNAANANDFYIDTATFKKIIPNNDVALGTAADIDYTIVQNQAIITSNQKKRPFKLYKSYSGVTYCHTAGLTEAQPYFGLLSSGGTGGGINFTYYWVRRFDYYVGDLLFSDYGKPLYHEVTNRNYYPSSTYPYVLQVGLDPLMDAEWPLYKTHTEVYRTYLGVPYLVATFGPQTNEFIDVFSNATISANPVLYTYGGVKSNDLPPMASYICSDGQTTYYADIYTPESSGRHSEYVREQFNRTKIVQSISLDPDSCPESFYANVDEDIKGIESVSGKTIVFTESRIYRLEGTFDELGAGGISPVEIHDHAGCVGHKSIVKSKDAIYWVGKDGFYVTNGYEVQKLPLKKNDLLDDTHKLITNPTLTKYSLISGAYDSIKNLIYWGCSFDPVESSPNGIMVYSINEDAFTTMSGDTTSSTPFNPTALDCNFTGIVRACGAGYLFQHTATELADYVYKSSIDTWYYAPIKIRYKSLKLDFGSPNENKYVTKITTNMRNLGNVNLQVTSYNDGRDTGNLLQEIRCVDYGTASFHNINLTDSSYVYGQDFIKTRRFPYNKLRCKHKVVDIQNFDGTIFWYDQGGYGKVTINSSAKTATLASGSWPTKVEQMSLYIEGDTNPYIINTRNSATELGLATAPAGNPSSKKWEIKGVEKGQEIDINSIEFDYMPYGMAGTEYIQSKDEVGNA